MELEWSGSLKKCLGPPLVWLHIYTQGSCSSNNSVTRVGDSTRVTILGDSSRLEPRC